ncbi:hypothetical protein D3C80_1953850 [compost metagenome]
MFPKVNGAVRASAQGQATINTAVKTLKAVLASIKIQYPKPPNAISNKIGVKYRLIASVMVLCF